MTVLNKYVETLEDKEFRLSVEKGAAEIKSGKGISLSQLKADLSNWRDRLPANHPEKRKS